MSLNTKIADKDKKPITIHLKDVPCTALRDYMDATIDIVVTGESKEFENKNSKTFSYTILTVTQIKIIEINSVYDCDWL